jgi:23S rRNA C2498 (ribose-2'-O)-methylase RlmM
MGMPKALASFDREMAQPSLLDSTITALLFSDGLKTRSQLTKKLLSSMIAKLVEKGERVGELTLFMRVNLSLLKL